MKGRKKDGVEWENKEEQRNKGLWDNDEAE
jgi:hypothetical protein